jgi:hypothetical protein
MMVQVKGSTFHFSSKVIFLTTPSDVKTTFASCDWIAEGQIAQLERRVTQIHVTANTILTDLILMRGDSVASNSQGEEETKQAHA